MDWERAAEERALTRFTARLARLRAEHPIFRRQRFFQGRPLRGDGLEDIAWLRQDARPMTDADWDGTDTRTLSVYLNGRAIPDQDDLGVPVVDDSFLLVLNSHHEPQAVTLPDEDYGTGWQVVVDTADPERADHESVKPGSVIDMPPRALLVLRQTDGT